MKHKTIRAPRATIVALVTASILAGVCAYDGAVAQPNHDPDGVEYGAKLQPFRPVAIACDHRIQFDAPPREVFALLNPAKGNHWTPTTPDYVFGAADKPGEAMWKWHDGWMVVADYNETSLTMKTVLYIPDIEFMIEEATCIPRDDGGTELHVTWRVAGLSEAGNEAVQNFFDTHWDLRMESIARTYGTKLAESKR